MSTVSIIGAGLIASVAFSCLITYALCRAAGRPAPMPHPEDLWGAYFDGGELPTLADRMDAAHTAVATAEAIVRAEYEAAS